MKKIKLLCLTFALTLSVSAMAQTVDINPTPHKIESNSSEMISTQNGFRLVKSNEKLLDALTFTTKDKGALKLRVEFGEKISKKYGVPQVDGAYVLESTDKGVVIAGYNERGAFYGIQTLLQLNKNNEIPAVTITDYPDIAYRGVVEGFYGTPWSHAVRVSLIDYYGKYKMNSYLYGPKDDPYHSSLAAKKDGDDSVKAGWREPYPEKEAKNIKDLVETSNRNRVDFIWAIHPGQDIKWTEGDYQKLRAKFESMYDLGVKSYAVFFDDISGEGTKAEKQAELLNRLHKEFVLVKGDVKPLIMCPTDYTELWADPKPTGYLSILGDKLDPSIHVMWTGEAICCDITDNTLEWINSRINRPTFIWWNYPVTDYVKHIIMQGPVYGNSQNADKDDMAGFVSNPMEHGEASKIALFGVAGYTWNIEDYNPIKNWERALFDLMPEATEAYRTFAINSTDTETGYRRDESWETTTFSVDNYTPEQFTALYEEFTKVKAAPNTIFAKAKNKLLVKELTPWLVEFEKLGARGLVAMDLIKLYEAKDFVAFWDLYRTTNMTAKELSEYKKHRSGTTKLVPFVNSARQDLALKFYSALSGKPAYETKAISSFKNVDSELGMLMLDGDTKTYYTSATAQKDGSWVGVDLGETIEVTQIYIEQGRNNVDDVDYFDSARLEVSEDGETWTTIKDKMSKQYVIDMKIAPISARYVRLSRLDDSERKNWMSVRRFEVNPTATEPVFATNITQLVGRTLNIEGKTVAIAPVLEVINIEPGKYFGIEMPIITAINNTVFDLGNKKLTAEFSENGTDWSTTANSAKYVRYTNKTDKALDVKLNVFKFDIVSSGDADISAAFDKDIKTAYPITAATVFAVPAGSEKCVILSNCNTNNKITVTQFNAEGVKLISEDFAKSIDTATLFESVATIEISGKTDVYEVIFK